MPGLFSGVFLTPEEQNNNDRHNIGVVVAVLAVLALYMYLFTYISFNIEIPPPQELAQTLGYSSDEIFDDDQNVDSSLFIPFNTGFTNDDERFLLFVSIAFTFLLAYFLPLRFKRPALVICFFVTLAFLYAPPNAVGFLSAHTLVYLVLHPVSRYRLWLSAIPGFLGVWAFSPNGIGSGPDLALACLAGAGSLIAYKYIILNLLSLPRVAPVLRTLVMQSAIITVFIGATLEGFTGKSWTLPLGLLLFFWHWQRLFMYHIDYKDGLVPKDISFMTYLSVFLTPGQLSNWSWGAAMGQGYSYSASKFLCEDKNKIVLSGLKLWGIALFYLVFGDLLTHLVRSFLNDQGILVFNSVRRMSCYFVEGGELSTLSVLFTSMIDMFRWFLLWAGVVHFKIGLWRVCGYKIDPYFNRFWLSTNLVVFWTRFNFHYREFLVKAFYYPTFFRFFKKHTRTRIFFATMAAACFGNFIWGHMAEQLFYEGMQLNILIELWRTWPYYFLLGTGISICELWLLKKRKRSRKPWTFDQYFWHDLLACYVTLQFFALIRIFEHPCDEGTIMEHFRMFMIGLGF